MRNFGLSKLAFIVLVVCITISAFSTAQAFTTLNLDGASGAYPLYGYPIEGKDTNFYGVTSAGGTYNQGTIYKLTPAGALTTLYNFCSKPNCVDGVAPYGALVQGTDGNFYGTTYSGGTDAYGTVFKITLDGTLTTLHSFKFTDGGLPYAGLVESGGKFYGTTWSGGAHYQGTVFEITSAGKVTTLYSFCSQTDCTDGGAPYAGLVEYGGSFYGTTEAGGANGLYGTVFKITPAGKLTTLHSFSGTDGEYPFAGLLLAGGNFYGTTQGGGANILFGTVFEITPAGALTTLHSFASTDGALPDASVILGTNGNLYGTTAGGGAKNKGTVFEITLAGQLTTLHSFVFSDGNDPGGLLQATNGYIYGTTSNGGTRYDGTIFSLSTATN